MLMIHNYTYIFFLSSLKLPDSYRNPEQASSSHAESSTFHVDHHLLAVSHLLFANTSPLVLLMLLALCKTSSIFLCLHTASKQQENCPQLWILCSARIFFFSCWRSQLVNLNGGKQLCCKLQGMYTEHVFSSLIYVGEQRKEMGCVKKGNRRC